MEGREEFKSGRGPQEQERGEDRGREGGAIESRCGYAAIPLGFNCTNVVAPLAGPKSPAPAAPPSPSV